MFDLDYQSATYSFKSGDLENSSPSKTYSNISAGMMNFNTSNGNGSSPIAWTGELDAFCIDLDVSLEDHSFIDDFNEDGCLYDDNYDYIHFATHHFKMSSPAARFLKRYHLQHHFQHHDAKYGVSSPLWDYVFRTAMPATQNNEPIKATSSADNL